MEPNGNQDDHDPAGIELYDLAQIKTTLDDGPFVYGQAVDFTIKVYNQGSIEASAIEITDYVPCGLLYDDSNDANGWSYSDATGIATVTLPGTLAPGDSTSIDVTFIVAPCYEGDIASSWTNVTEISDSESEDQDEEPDDVDSNPDDDQDNEGPSTDDETDGDPNNPDNPDEDDHDPETLEVFDLALIKFIEDKGPYDEGEIAEYIIRVYNQGNVDAVNVEVTDYLNTGYLFDATANAGWTQTGDLVQTVIAGPIAPGDSVELTLNLEVAVPADAMAGSWYNEADISAADDDDDPNNDPPVDADSDPDTDPDNDNPLVDGPDDDIIFDEDDDNDNVINENPDDPFDLGDDDEDDNDAAEIIVVGGLGDTVFKDIDGDGIQDADEPGVEGVVAILTDCEGNELATTVTDADGFYFFNNLIPGDYQVQFDISGLPEGCAFTFQDQGGDDVLDSDVDINGLGPCTNIQGGEYDSTYDAGLLILAEIGDFVWHDLDGDGVQDSDEPGIPGVQVDLYDGEGNLVGTMFTDADGNYLFENLYPGEYYLDFGTPDGFDPTFQDQGGNDATDSDADPVTGLTIVTTLDPGESDLSWDAGFYICIPVGEFVWYDTDFDDFRDFNENGINGLLVQLYKFNGSGYELYDEVLTGLKPGTQSTDGYFKFCAPPGQYYVAIDIPPYGLVPARKDAQGFIPLTTNGEQTTDNDMDRFGRSDAFTVRSGDELCNIGAGYYPMATVGNLVWFDENGDGEQDSSEPRVSNVAVEVFDVQTNQLIEQTVTNAAGNYEVDYLQPSDYYLRFTPPSGYAFTLPNVGGELNDSDVDNANGPRTTRSYAMLPGQNYVNVDAGLISGVLPVDWLNISVRRVEDKYHVLTWSTAQEINSSHFVVERQLNTGDWKALGEVLSAGTTTTEQTYNYRDEDVTKSGSYRYRVMQVDLDGTTSYSKEVAIEVSGDLSVEAYPNPTSGIINLDIFINDDIALEVALYDVEGRLVARKLVEEEVKEGYSNRSIDLSVYPAGVYNLKIKLGKEVLNRKVILIK